MVCVGLVSGHVYRRQWALLVGCKFHGMVSTRPSHHQFISTRHLQVCYVWFHLFCVEAPLQLPHLHVVILHACWSERLLSRHAGGEPHPLCGADRGAPDDRLPARQVSCE